MAKKQRAFFDWQQQAVKIIEAGPKFDLSDLSAVNHTELVQLCQLLNPDGGAHMGMDRTTLEEIIVGVVPKVEGNPVDRYRARLNTFIQGHWDKIRDQLDVNCSGDCYKCHDLMVLGCFVTNADHLRREPEEG